MAETTLGPIRKIHQTGDFKTARERLEEIQAQDNGAGIRIASKTLTGVILLQEKNLEAGIPLIKEVCEIKPETSGWASDLGLGLILAGEPGKAREVLELAVTLPEPDGAAYNRLATARQICDDPAGAKAAFEEALLREPGRAEVHCNLGGVCLQLGELEEGLMHYERALHLMPDLPPAVKGRTTVLVALGRTDEEIIELEERLEVEPDSIFLRQRLAFLLEASDRVEEACSILKDAHGVDAKNVAVLMQLGKLLFSLNRFQSALNFLSLALEVEPAGKPIKNLLARIYCEMRKYDEAYEIIEELLADNSEMPVFLLTRAHIHSECNKFDQAEKDLRKIIEMHPGSADAWGRLGHVLMLTGRIDEAVECHQRASELNPTALASLIEARSFPDDPQVIEQMVSLSENPLMPKEPRASMSFALTKLFEKQKEYDRAFNYANQGNELVHRMISFEPDRNHRIVQRLKQVYSKRLFARFEGAGSNSSRPVFVVGMPRSGTTLTEQILCSHPDVYGAGELGYLGAITRLMPRVLKTRKTYPLCLQQLEEWMAEHGAAYYLKKIAALDDTAVRVVDKMPHNFMNVGLIALIFPNARIIHVNRDLRDIAISNYFTNFKRHGGLGYSFSLENIGHMLNDYQEIMAHWRKVLPMPIFELQYEELVENPEEMSKKLFEFIGLDWDERVMEFYKTERAVKTASVWQVRQPIYKTSKERWRQYEKHLGPLLEVLDMKRWKRRQGDGATGRKISDQ